MLILFISQTEHISETKSGINVWTEFQSGQNYQSHKLIFSHINHKAVKLCFLCRGLDIKGKNKIKSN